MANLEYEAIFSSFLTNVTAYSLATIPQDEGEEIMLELLHRTIGKPYIYRLFSDIKFDDEILEYTLRINIHDTLDEEFVLQVLGKGMTLQWLTPKIISETNISQLFSGKETKWYSQSNHLSTLIDLKNEIESDIKHLIMYRGYVNNSYLEEA